MASAVALLAFSAQSYAQVGCTSDEDPLCNDNKSCTVDACKHLDTGGTVCQHSRQDTLCPDDGFSCTHEGCDPSNGNSDPTTGCIRPRVNEDCNDEASCTTDGCNPTAANHDPITGCIFSRDDSQCNDSEDCTNDGCNPTAEGSDEDGCVFSLIEDCCRNDDDCPSDSQGIECIDNYCDLETHTCKIALIQSGARVSGDQKGSLLVFSKIEIKWDADGNLIQDTILDMSNDADLDGVEVQAYFVNGDRQIEERYDMEGNVVQEFEPGWNTADCRFHMTKNQPHFWSAANGSTKCQPFTVLDEDGRLDSEVTDGTRLLRGFVIMWAVKFTDPQRVDVVAGISENGYWEEIRWNHLKGDAVIVNYRLGSAWEYNAWAYQARCGVTGEALRDCTQYAELNYGCLDSAVIPGRLDMDGYQYDSNFDELLLDFYASGSTGLSSIDVGVMVDTDLTLHSMDVDVRQDGEGPILTKAEFEIFNENESKFSGTRRCICCWDQTLLSNYVRTVAVPNHFLRSKLGTNKGYARIDGVHSTECDYYDICGIEPRRMTGWAVAGGGYDLSRGTALVGLAFKILTFTGTGSNTEWAGGNLHGTGEQPATIVVDVEQGSGEAQGGP